MVILVGGIAILVFLTLILILRNVGGGGAGSRVAVEFWGVFDDRTAFDKIIRDFQIQNPGITVVYRQFSFEDYEREIVNALAGGTGPDVWMIHHTWLPKHIDKLLPLPEKIKGLDKPLMTFRDFQDQFVEVAVNDLTAGGQIYAMPLYVDTLALYYNRDLFNSAGITSPPKNWNEFNDDVELLTRVDSSGNITQSGATIGTSQNVNRSTDILVALMLQSGVRMTDIDNTSATFSRSVNNTPVGEVALRYYSDFANPNVRTYTWNNGQHYSIDAFTEGTVAMMFNYSHQAGILNQRAARLNYAIAPMSQISESNIKNYANYWAVAVSKNSLASNEAWRFAAYLASREGASSYLAETMRPSARRDIIDLQKNDLRLGIFANQALTAKSWYQVDNAAIESIFAEMIDDVNFGRLSVREALQNAEAEVNVLMQRVRRSR
ncbi:MAG: extracellular solute-binding protein [Candidatus Yanofskybacteria bacterium]|nr:extracellular solute-binding protein [Candidatus Yanofskybacteria bacterium]